MVAEKKIDILLATYNSEIYLKETIESIIKQTYTNWRLLIRDDCSTDNTLDILRSYEKTYPNKMVVIEGDENIGACQNFGRLMELSDSEYVMFCDNDDIWLPDKIMISLNKMKELNDIHNKDVPILIHTDMVVVDDKLKVLANSYWCYQNIDPGKNSLSRLLLQNVVTGCTMMINSKLRQRATPIPKEIIMHDWWLALIASAIGKIEPINIQTLLYRQHGGNIVGAPKRDFAYALAKIRCISDIRTNIKANQAQARMLLNRFVNDLTEYNRNCLVSFINIFNYNYIKRRYCLFRYKLLKNSFARNLAMLIYI